MGGHAFKNLHCPRMSPVVYTKVKSIATVALQGVFSHVTVPFEIPNKIDYGDCDFLVSAPLDDSNNLTFDTFPFQPVVEAIKHALDTPHGRRGILTPGCLFFAIPMPPKPMKYRSDDNESRDEEQESWVQVDVKICFKPQFFSWMKFTLNYASQSSILGSMIKPLGMTLDHDGLHVRVEEIESTNWTASMVWVTKDPWTVCRVLGLDRKAVDGTFDCAEETYRAIAESWLFHPEHFKADFNDDGHFAQHPHRSYFLKTWIPERYPEYRLDNGKQETLEVWTARTRAAVREKVFTMFPRVADEYYVKLSHRVKEVEECRLRNLVTAAIPTGTSGWRDDFDLPQVIIRPTPTNEAPSISNFQLSTQHDELTPPPSPPNKHDNSASAFSSSILPPSPHNTSVYIDALPHQPPYSWRPSPPPKAMSAAARLTCLARWTAFSATGTPYLLSSPHAKGFDLQWYDAAEAGCGERELMKWAEDMWWVVWLRQSVVNWRGLWARRFEKDDVKAEARKEKIEKVERGRMEDDARIRTEELTRRNKEKVATRVKGLGRALGSLGAEM